MKPFFPPNWRRAELTRELEARIRLHPKGSLLISHVKKGSGSLWLSPRGSWGVHYD